MTQLFLATKAMPNRQPETEAKKLANRMLTYGGAPLPVRTIQQNGTFCPSCGEYHRPGKTCGVKSMGSFLDQYLGKGTITVSTRRGNPHHDSETGRFAATPSSAAPGGSGGGAPAATAPGKGPRPAVAGAPSSAKTPSVSATAATMEAPVPGVAKPAAAPKAPSVGVTSPGKKPGAAAPSKSPRLSPIEAIGTTPTQRRVIGEIQEPRVAGVAAYHQHRNAALAGGKSPQEAHELGKQHGMQAWDAAIESRRARKEAERGSGPGTPLVAPTDPGARAQAVEAVRALPGRYRSPKPGIPGRPGTSMRNAGPGADVGVSRRPTSVSLAPAISTGQYPLVTPTTPTQTATTPTTTQTPRRPAQGRAAGGTGGGINPWQMYGIGGAVGSGMFTPGGTFAPTAHGVVQTAHGLLRDRGEQRPPAALARQEQLQQAAKPKKVQSQQSSAQAHP